MRSVIFACNSDLMAIPTAVKLHQNNLLAAVVLPEKNRDRLLPSLIASGIPPEIIHAVNKHQLAEQFVALINNYNASSVIVLTFPWKLPDVVLNFPVHGCINMHPGLLPKYRGADPVFWQLKNKEAFGGITAHYMTSTIDDGPIILMQQMPIIPGEPYGMHCQRVGLFASDLILQIASLIKEMKPASQDHIHAGKAEFFNSPDKTQLRINWEKQPAIEIESLVNACNPKYTGAITSIRGIQLAIVEVSPADVNNVTPDVVPGTIVYADALYGLVVKCCDNQFLKINIVCMNEGYISGAKMFNLGFRSGEVFH